ncbi:MAG: hypothetical protein Q4P78_03030 [Rothia sp. (in: high G+C Gram-positive bacteria)]|uniref:tetratricopeptide repeat protein n=1 Tax=Rothia sp. (in: high G+C Gram-positive bacteria) TaxID=1885016 RepID=UPI0026DEC288|nr:hypothetical protein [Rothia sp. (in: high G+C Gram-positive bacteria)]MDO5750163.1 hypothetical protein [Rothia sp. (in: high G+C Gram-positive bacteria)]
MAENITELENSIRTHLISRDWLNLHHAATDLNKLDPGNLLALTGLARAHQNLGQLEAAYTYAHAASTKDATNTDLLELEAEIAQQMGNNNRAIELYTQLKNLDPLEPRYISALTAALNAAGRIDEAQKEALKGAEFFGADSGLGNVHRSIVATSLDNDLQQARSLARPYKEGWIYTSKENAETALRVLTGASSSLFEATAQQQTDYAYLVQAAESTRKRRFSWPKHWAAVLYAIFVIPMLFAPLTMPGSFIQSHYKQYGEGAPGAFVQGIMGFGFGVACCALFIWLFFKYFYIPGWQANARLIKNSARTQHPFSR